MTRIKVLVPGLAGKRLFLKGTGLSAEDGAILVPSSADCGDPHAKEWPPSWQKHISRLQDLTSNFDAAHVDFLAPSDTGSDASAPSHKICFCEAPNCSQSWRFGQGGSEVALGDPASCESSSPYLHIPLDDLGFGSHRMFFVRVGSRLVGLTNHGNRSNELPVLDMNSTEVRGLKLGALRVLPESESIREKCRTAAVIDDMVYVLQPKAESLLVLVTWTANNSVVGCF